MKKLSAVVVFGVLASIVACAAPAAEEEADESGEALSAATCTPRAEAAKKKSITACKAANTVDWAACMKPANDASIAFEAKKEAALAPVREQVAPITASCKAAIDDETDAQIVEAAMPNATDFAKAKARADANGLEALRARRKTTCDVDARGEILAELGAGNALVLLLQDAATQDSYYGTMARCATNVATAYVKSATCTGALAYQNTWASCRKQCSTLSNQACTPSDYGQSDVACGKLVNDKGFALTAGQTCEESFHCARTTICDQYDSVTEPGFFSLSEHASCPLADGTKGIVVASIKKDAQGRASGVESSCQKAQ